ncbi:MAG TPA: heme biosynthesis HemY N-terminal domain-containing protein [Pelomicrobium sp.]|nr:heme biosynthesis HemY N-terminal domain-containing protein [Pelomicrobium sp.]
MKGLLWLVALAAAAVAVTLLAREGSGYVLIVAGGYRTELSVNFAVVLILTAFLAFYLLLRLVAGTISLPRKLRARRQRSRERRSHRYLADGFTAFFEGRYVEAEKSAARALKLGEDRPLAATLAAHAAQRQRQPERRDEYLATLDGAAPAERRVADLARAEFLLEDGEPRRALEVVQGIRNAERKPPAGALRLALKAHQRTESWDEVLGLLAEEQKRLAVDPAHVDRIKHRALAESVRSRADDLEALKRYWKGVTSRDQENAEVAAAAAAAFNRLGECRTAHEIVEASLAREWAPHLLPLYAECPEGDAARQIQRAEGWLREHPDDAVLLLTLGRLCTHAGLWGKAQSYMEASLSVEPTFSAYLALAELNERLDRPEAARDAYRRSLDLALAQLRAATGGRRRSVI